MINLALLAGEWEYLTSRHVAGGPGLPIANINPRRFSITFTYNDPDPTVNQNSAVVLITPVIGDDASGFFIPCWTPLVIDYPHHGGLVGLQWYATKIRGPGGNVDVVEVIQTAGPRSSPAMEAR